MLNFKKGQKEFFYLLPILIIYVGLIFIVGRDNPIGDGERYWQFSENILNGFYANKDLSPGFLWNGPGYPLFIAFLRLFNLTTFSITLFNSLFIYLSSVFFFKTLINYLSFNKSLFLSYFMIASNLTLPIYATYLYTEPITLFLVTLILYFIFKLFKTDKNKYIVYSSIAFTFLILIKVIFAYFLPILVILLFFLKDIFLRKIFLTLVLSLLFTLPYQIYTYNLTQKVFYWSDAGGDLLYWISSTEEIDLGQWQEKNTPLLKETIKDKYSNLNPNLLNSLNDKIFENRNKVHGAFLDSIKNFNGIEKDNALKHKALKNIKNNKLIFLKNWLFNVSRLFTGSPTSLYFKPPNTPIRSLINIALSSFLLFIYLISVCIFILNPKKHDKYVLVIFLFFIIYLGGTSLLAVQSQRFLIPITPALFLFSGIILNNTIKLKIKND